MGRCCGRQGAGQASFQAGWSNWKTRRGATAWLALRPVPSPCCAGTSQQLPPQISWILLWKYHYEGAALRGMTRWGQAGAGAVSPLLSFRLILPPPRGTIMSLLLTTDSVGGQQRTTRVCSRNSPSRTLSFLSYTGHGVHVTARDPLPIGQPRSRPRSSRAPVDPLDSLSRVMNGRAYATHRSRPGGTARHFPPRASGNELPLRYWRPSQRLPFGLMLPWTRPRWTHHPGRPAEKNGGLSP